jgi:16S rRNA C967 or C1407 C5-methylase (RsmB/RsmF family)/NOL1/NOP2/fmu family ribosome biogenesis protein
LDFPKRENFQAKIPHPLPIISKKWEIAKELPDSCPIFTPVKEKPALTKAFEDRMRRLFPNAEKVLHALEGTADVSIRKHPRKVKQALGLEKVPWCETAYYLPERPMFAADPWWHAGAYYVQEAGSMLLEKAFLQCVEAIEQPTVLDLCAAPGGKSTHLLSLLDGKGVLVSNETIRSRIAPLRENLLRWGYANMILTGSDPKEFSKLPEIFDVVVVDAPCSGEGLFRREPQARNEWSTDNAAMCALRQQRILEDVWPCLKSGGYLIYSTCTFNPAENDENIRVLLEKEEAEWMPLAVEHIPNMEFGLQAAPGLTRSEGFYMAVLRKTGMPKNIHHKTRKEKTLPNKLVQETASTMLSAEWQKLRQHPALWSFANAETWQLMDRLEKIYIAQAGFPLGEEKGKDFLLSEFAPFSVDLELNNKTELPLEDAWRYLRKETQLQTHTEKGNGVFTFQSVNIGAYKNIGNRLNNNFPKEWRLRAEMNELNAKRFLLSQYLKT